MKPPRVPERTTPGFAFSIVDRALQECLATRQFGQEEIKKVLNFFGADQPECVYCGDHHVRRWDHLAPVREGGKTVFGNIVPARATCDDSKRHQSFEKWMMSEARLSPKSRGVGDVEQRVERIKAYMQHFGYIPRSLEERLDEHEWGRLTTIRSRLQELREDVDVLIKDYRTRTGNT